MVLCVVSPGIAQLKLSCYESMAAVEVVTTGDGDVLDSTRLQGRCITPERLVDGDRGDTVVSGYYVEDKVLYPENLAIL